VPPPVEFNCIVVLAQNGPVLVAVAAQVLVHDAGDVIGVVKVHVGSAEKVAVILQAAPFAVKPGNVYEIGLVQGKPTVVLGPQLLEIVNVPDVGG
jgi:hypothetical protein